MDRSNDPVYVEECSNLTTVEQHIDAVIAAQTASAQSLQQEINDSWICSDYESVYERKMLMAKQRECFDRADEYATFKPSPYFGRMDFDVAESGEVIKEGVTYFIGKADIQSVDKKQIVVDWRNPVGTFFYQKTQRYFLINEYKYTLLLRRALDIKNARLCDFETEYDGEDVSLDGDVIDPFLLTVLKDKRRQTRLTDIIRTIQDNQNSIIRRPYGDSFAVQGCAGSGKTMILLHRLSYLMYNNPKLPLSNIKIITPNKYFDAHISDLSRELGLTNIDRYSVDEYYYYLAQKYHKTDKSMPPIRSEKSLDENLLLEVYSLQYADDMIKRYSAYWQKAIEQLASVGYQALFHQFNQNTPVFSAYNIDTYTQLVDGLRRIDDQITATQKGIKDAETRLVSNRALTQTEEEKMNAANSELQRLQSEVRSAIEKEAKNKQKELEDVQEQNSASVQAIKAANDTIELLTKKVADAREEAKNAALFLQTDTYDSYNAVHNNSTLCALIDDAVTDPAHAIFSMRETVAEIEKQHDNLDLSNQDNISYVKSMLDSIKANRASYVEYEQFSLLPEDDPVHFSLYRSVEKQVERIVSLKQQFESAARYNFVLRNRIRRDLDSALDAFREQATNALNTIEQDAHRRLSSYDAQLASIASKLMQAKDELAKQNELFSTVLRSVVREYIEQQRAIIYTSEKSIKDSDAKLTELQANRDELRKRERYLKSLPPIYQDALERLKNFGFVSLVSLTDKPRELLTPFVTELNRKYEAFKTIERRVRMLQDSIPQLEKQIEQLKSKGISSDTIRCWADCKKIADSLSFEEIETGVAHTQLLEAYRKHGQNYNQYTYRHKMYLTLLFCTLYFKRPGISDSFLNIDEAQDISVAEYRMLSSILGPRCTYNLYGDVNQAVYSYKGINVWEEDIPDIVHGNVFMLNENYRNTIPVTDYCNQEFDVGMTAIGIGGDKVVEKDLQEAVQWIVQMKKNTPEARAAIIYRHGIKSIQDKLRTLLKPLIDFSWSDVDDHRLSVVSVEMAKGLEFEYVVAVTDQMSDNERYVSFTRAMEALVVVPDTFARNIKSNTDDDDSDDTNNSAEVKATDKKGLGTEDLFTEHQREAAAEMNISDLLQGPRYQILVDALAASNITTCAELMSTNLWTYMNRNRLYTIKDRFAVKQEVEALLAEFGKEETVDQPESVLTELDTENDPTPTEHPTDNPTDGTEKHSISLLPYEPSEADLLVEQQVKDADLDGISFENLYNDMRWSRNDLWDSIDRNPKIININGMLYHQESLIDWNEAADVLDVALQRLLSNAVFINKRVLYDTVRFDLDMFMNDNSITGEDSVYAMARHLFEKVHFNHHQYWFYNGLKISRQEDNDGLSNLSLAVNYAREKSSTVSFDDLVGYFESNGLKTGNFRMQLQINTRPVFLVYQPNEYLLAEAIGIDEAWLDKVAKAISSLLDEAGLYVIMRDLSSQFYSRLPRLPFDLEWTPLLLQQILFYWGEKLGARTVTTYANQDSNALNSFAVPYHSPIQTFPHALAVWVTNEGIEQKRYEAGEFRQALIRRGIIASNELGSVFVKALSGDPHFAWDHDEKTVLVRGETL